MKGWVQPWTSLNQRISDLSELATLLQEEPDEDMEEEWRTELRSVRTGLEALELRTMLQGEDDHREAILTIQPGAGGTESQDWAEMLMRMYTRWAERRGFQVSVMDLQEGEEAGIKGVSLEIKGDHALWIPPRREGGPTGWFRISPFDSQARRHTLLRQRLRVSPGG